MGIARRIVEPKLQFSVLYQKTLGEAFSPAGYDPAVAGFGFCYQFSFDSAHGFLSETSAGISPCLEEISNS
jgi:hypothetical protein